MMDLLGSGIVREDLHDNNRPALRMPGQYEQQ